MAPTNNAQEGNRFTAVFSAWKNLSPRARWLRMVSATFFLILVAIYLFIFAGLPNDEEIKTYQPASTIKLERLHWGKRTTDSVRIWVPLKKISPHLQKAVIISEDDTFYQHDGINYEMMQEAIRVDLEKGRYVRGASTITMQLARNAFLHRRKTITRKIRELILTRRIEENLSKARILELYLNIVEWGEGIYGAEAASRYYFGKAAANLNLAEATLLASMLPNPKYFNPFKRLASVRKMQKRVVGLMENAREITAAQAQWALAGVTLRSGVSTAETQPVAADSLEEARYFEPTSEAIEIAPLFSPTPVAADSTAQPDSSAAPDSAATNQLD